jgi:hypothetical protein
LLKDRRRLVTLKAKAFNRHAEEVLEIEYRIIVETRSYFLPYLAEAGVHSSA